MYLQSLFIIKTESHYFFKLQKYKFHHRNQIPLMKFHHFYGSLAILTFMKTKLQSQYSIQKVDDKTLRGFDE